MATSVSTRSAGRLNPTRQQLDELDALLQRMLDLPVHPLDEPEQAEAEEAIEESPPPVMNAAPPLATAEGPGAQEPVAEPFPTVLDPGEGAADADFSPLEPAPRPAVSYMVIETASPRPLPPASGFEPRQPTPVLVPVTPQPEAAPAAVQIEEQELRSKEFGEKSEEQFAPHPSLASPYYDHAVDESSVPEPDGGEMWVPLRSTWQPSPQTWPPLAESWHQANSGTPFAASQAVATPRIEPDLPPSVDAASRAAPEVRLGSPDLPSAPTVEPSVPPAPDRASVSAEPQLSLSAEDAPATVPAPLLPLLWFNQGFDACLAPLGAPGRWLCGSGRSWMGFLGLACLAAAAVIAVSARMAWTW